VEVRRDEELAVHIVPEPCDGTRGGDGESSAEERIGQPRSSESRVVPGADVVYARYCAAVSCRPHRKGTANPTFGVRR
jgi:hypothetical protein